MATKHMNAAPGDFADTVLMPGDPLRAQYIADTYLEGARRVTDVRNMWGFTGEYKGRAVSVMAHGMGIPSASIYCTELITEYDVKRVIRVGSCGTSHPDVQLWLSRCIHVFRAAFGPPERSYQILWKCVPGPDGRYNRGI